jgi:4-amino-4-deoxy-L-arabinose transferase-like glycosyltransferase
MAQLPAACRRALNIRLKLLISQASSENMWGMSTVTAEPKFAGKIRPNAPQLASVLLPLLLVLLASSSTFFSCLSDHPIFNPDEGLYAEPAREMLDTGEYITTLLNYVVRFTKPPLVIWLMAFSYKIFGVNEFAARYVCAASGVILVGVTYLFARRYLSPRTALITGLCLSTAPLFVGTAREAITDMPLSLFMGGALMSLLHGFRRRQMSFCYLGYVLVGLAVMTKGPVGLLLPGVIMVLYHGLRGELLTAWRQYKPLLGLAIVLAIALPWFAVEIYITKGAYYQEFLVRENFQRFTSVVDHKGAWWYHIAAMAGGFFPWTLFAPQALLLAGMPQMARLKNWKGGICSQESENIIAEDADGTLLFLGIWLVITVAFFSASVSKLLPYTVPAFPALAMIVAAFVDKQWRLGKRAWLAIPLSLLAAVGGVALYVVPRVMSPLHDLPPTLPGLVQSLLLFFTCLSVAGLLLLRLANSRIAFGCLLAGTFAVYAVFGEPILDTVSNEWEGPVPWFSNFASLSGEPIVVYHMRKPSVPFYAHRQVIVPAGAPQLARLNTELNSAYLIARRDDLDELAKLPDIHLQVRCGRYALLHWHHAAH